jgi:hypothetical protein
LLRGLLHLLSLSRSPNLNSNRFSADRRLCIQFINICLVFTILCYYLLCTIGNKLFSFHFHFISFHQVSTFCPGPQINLIPRVQEDHFLCISGMPTPGFSGMRPAQCPWKSWSLSVACYHVRKPGSEIENWQPARALRSNQAAVFHIRKKKQSPFCPIPR